MNKTAKSSSAENLTPNIHKILRKLDTISKKMAKCQNVLLQVSKKQKTRAKLVNKH